MASFFKKVGQFFTGTPEKHERVSTLLPEQQQNYQQLQNSAQRRGAGGAWGDVSDYYRNNLSDNPADFNAFAAPALRQYNEDIVPGIAEQFAGFGGSGSLNSSGFRNAQIQGATDLSERLGALRAGLRHSSAQGLQGIGQAALGNYSQDVTTQQGSPGFLSEVANGIGQGIGSFGGNWLTNKWGGNKTGANSTPDWKGPASAQIAPRQQLPNFMGR
jgi:hypothetical protein